MASSTARPRANDRSKMNEARSSPRVSTRNCEAGRSGSQSRRTSTGARTTRSSSSSSLLLSSSSIWQKLEDPCRPLLKVEVNILDTSFTRRRNRRVTLCGALGAIAKTAATPLRNVRVSPLGWKSIELKPKEVPTVTWTNPYLRYRGNPTRQIASQCLKYCSGV